MLLSGCGQVETSSDTPDINNSSGSLSISGKITFDRVPVKQSGKGLDYRATTKEPARQIVVKAIDASNHVLAKTTTDDTGAYHLENLPKDTPLKIRAYAKMLSNQWDVTVVDNTSGQSIYAIEGNLVSTGSSNAIRNLHASSGWDIASNDYISERQAAPFAIIDSIYTGMQKILSVDSDAKFPLLRANWSIHNTPSGSGTDGELRDGLIVTSHYGGADDLYILGDKDSDTDEYDDHIIIHEWGHYFEAKFSRADNIGGSHGEGERLDIRVAFGEGWGNAISAIATDDPIYFDTMGLHQDSGWFMDIENQPKKTPGWFSEASIQRILYDLYDNNDDDMDRLSLGFAPIYNTLTTSQKTTPAFTSLFSFITNLKNENPDSSSAIDDIVASEEIDTISEIYGDDHHDLYSDMQIGSMHQVCLSTQYGKRNKLYNRRYIRFTLSSSNNYTIRVVQNNGSSSDPDFYLYKTDPFSTKGTSEKTANGQEEASYALSAGDYLLDVADYNGINNACFTVSIN